MATWIAHLRITENLLAHQRRDEKNGEMCARPLIYLSADRMDSPPGFRKSINP